MADQNGSMYRLNINRNKTQKWQTAKQPTYGGGWGDSDEDEYDAPPALPPVPQSVSSATTSEQHSYTNPGLPPITSASRRSFDGNDDNGLRSNNDMSTQDFQGYRAHATQVQGSSHPPLHLNTQVQPSHFQSGNRQVHSADNNGISNVQTAVQRSTNDESKHQSSTPVHGSRHIMIGSTTTPQDTGKALPFVRPADIYKRVEEEREKERQSQDSNRLGGETTSRNTSENPVSVRQVNQAPESTLGQTTESGPDVLQHQPSLGYRSVVHKAFDDEAHDTFSPSTTTESLPRSNSASTTDISPIITRRTDPILDASSSSGLRTETIPEEPVRTRGRPESSSTIKPEAAYSAEAPLQPPVVPPGFRRDSNSPSPSNSPARRPLSVTGSTLPAAEQGVLSSMTLGTSTQDSIQDPEIKTPTTTAATSHTQGTLLSAPANSTSTAQAISRSASEDWQEWKEQRRSFHAKHGTDAISSASPSTSPPTSRAASLSKPVASNVTGPSQSEFGHPATSMLANSEHPSSLPRPIQQARLESFRPSLPGGWQSDTTIGSSDRREEVLRSPQPPYIQAEDRTDSLESVPTATAPKNWGKGSHGAVESAFAAAAAAGSAMAGAFSGPHLTQDTSQDSESDSENEAYPGESKTSVPTKSATRDFASSPKMQHASSNFAGATLPASGGTTAYSDNDEQQQHTDYPAPLRTTRSMDNRTSPSRASMLSPSVTTGYEDPDQLQHDIVQSLTPKASMTDQTSVSKSAPSQDPDLSPMHKRDDSVGSYDPAIEQAYGSYWQDTPRAQATVHEQVTGGDLPNSELADDLKMQDHHMTSAQTIPTTATTIASNPPLLEQRFSWETQQPSSSQQQNLKKATNDQPSLTSAADHDEGRKGPVSEAVDTSAISKPVETVTDDTIDRATRTSFEQPTSEVISHQDVSTPAPDTAVVSTSSFARDAVDFRNIMSYDNAHQRIRAFDDNRRIYAEPNGLLDNWLASMNVPEHAATFANSQQVRPVQQASQSDSTPIRRESHLPAGTKQIQEDGKRLLAAAGKYGGKAGIAAKGLFARGKEKLRTASAGDKVPVTQRRKSTLDETSVASSPQSQRSNLPPTAASASASSNPPQLPTPAEEISWSLISSTIDQYFQDPASPQSRNPSLYGQRFSQLGIKGELTRKDRRRTDSLPLDTRVTPAVADTTQRTPKSFSTSPAQITETSFLANPSPDTQTAAQRGMFESTSQQSTPRAPQVDHGLKPLPAMPALQASHQEEESQMRRRRPSSVSEVSDMSRDHDPDDTKNPLARVVSPPPGHRINPRSQETSTVLSSDFAKEADSRKASATAGSSLGPLPLHQKPTDQNNVQPRIAPGTKIVPVVGLKNSKPVEPRSSARPFSFVGPESSTSSNAVGRQPPPTSPDSSDEQQGELDEKNMEPNIKEHPAYRRTPDNTQEDTAINPLPSSKRPREELERVKQQHSQQSTRSEEHQGGYRIPGPYVQEYRPPKPKNSNGQIKNYNKSPVVQTEPVRTPTPQAEDRAAGHSADVAIAEPHSRINLPAANKAEKSPGLTLGGFFRPRSESRGQLDRMEYNNGYNNTSEDKKRKLFFRLNGAGRPSGSAMPPQSMQQNGYGGMAATPYEHKRKTSADMFKLKAPGDRVSTDGKKKRMSALAGLFSRSNKGQSRSSTSMSQYTDLDYNQQRPGAPPATQMASSAPSGGFGRGEFSMHSPYSPYPPTAHEEDLRGAPSPAYPDLAGFPKPPRQKTWHDASDDFARPENLRVDTRGSGAYGSNGQSGSISMPHTATSAYPMNTGATHMTSYSPSPTVPTTYAPRDISYRQDLPYVPPSSPPKKGPTGQGIMASHVKNLNKRSRSPRLGRPPSDEVLHGPYSANADRLEPEPVQRLGTFSNRKASPIGGSRPEEDQEGPWKLTLPGGGDAEDDERHIAQRDLHSRSNSIQRSPPQKYAQPAYESSQGSIQPENMLPARPREVTAAAQVQSSRYPRGQSDFAPPTGQANYVSSPQERDAARQGQVPTQRYMNRTPSPFLSNNDVSQSNKPFTTGNRIHDFQSADRSTTPTANPPNNSRSYTIGNGTTGNSDSNVPKSADPQTSIVRGDTITTTMTVGPGANTQLVTKVDPPPHPAPSHSQPRAIQIPPSTPIQSPSQSQLKQQQQLRSPTTPISNQRLSPRTEPRSPDGVSPYKSMNTPSSVTNNLRTPDRDRNSSVLSPNQLAVTPQAAGREKPQLSGHVEESHPTKTFAPVELPGSKPDGYESEEEPVMSATAYPGQEWMPAWDRWED